MELSIESIFLDTYIRLGKWDFVYLEACSNGRKHNILCESLELVLM